MRTYRPPRPGDLLAVRTTDPLLDGAQVVISTAVDNGGYILLGGQWQNHTLEVLIRRIGDTQPTKE